MSAPTLQPIADWLEKLGLGQYAQRFTENEIDVSVLRHLTDQDFKDIGIPLGHRRKILAAISEAAGPAAPKPETAVGPTPQDTAERRQVTVMFSDLVGSTALSARMDPEDLREVISAYQKCVGETVQRFGGFVAKYMGDGVLIYFGYPQAHEDDAERAIRAGLELIQAVGRLKCNAPLQTRVGIATGLVVVGDLIGSGALLDRAADMIISGGFNIWPTELENAIATHPAVMEVAVFGIPHRRWGETPCAVVVPKSGRTIDVAEVVQLCAEQLGSYKKPGRVVVRDEPLPKTPVGKIKRRELREPFWVGHARRVAGS